MLTLFALGTHSAVGTHSTQGLMLTLCALGLIKPSTQGVNVNPLRTGLN